MQDSFEFSLVSSKTLINREKVDIFQDLTSVLFY